MTYPTITLTPTTNPRGRMGGPDKDIPVMSFVPFLEGACDLYVPGDPAEQIAYLIALREEAGALAIQVQRHHAELARVAQEAAMATYPEAVAS